MSFTAPTILWAGLTPVAVILGAAVLGVLLEALVPRRARPVLQPALAVLAILGAGAGVVVRWRAVEAGVGASLTTGFDEDPFGVAAQGIMLVIGLLAVLVMADRTTADDGAFAAQAADRPGSAEEAESLHAGWTGTEVFPLTLFSLARHRRLLSQEAALKYFVLGAFASAFLLMGAALLYGFSGSVSYTDIAAAIRYGAVPGMDRLMLAGAALVVVGLLFKIAAVPFHAWSPDVYQGAPTPVTGFMAAGVKATAFLALVRFVYIAVAGLSWDLAPVLWAVSLATMAVGTVVGVVQRDVKRMLAYSAIAHAGYMLIGIISLNQQGVAALLVYCLAYGVATVGAFGVVTLVRTGHDGAAGPEATDLDSFRGLGRRSPWLAAAMTVFLLSFAGVPLTFGFMAKFELFVAGVGGSAWLVVAAVVSSAATAFFYMRLILLMFFHEPRGETVIVVGSRGPTAAAIGTAAFLTVALGVLPQAVLVVLGRAAMLMP